MEPPSSQSRAWPVEGSGSVLGTMLGVLPHHLADDWRSHKSSRGDAGDCGVVRTVNPRRGGAVRVTWRHRTKPGVSIAPSVFTRL